MIINKKLPKNVNKETINNKSLKTKKESTTDNLISHKEMNDDLPGIKIQNVCKAYKSLDGTENQVFNGLTLFIEPGTFTGIVGINGSGKTTLAHMLNGLVVPDQGEVYVDGFLTSDFKNRKEVRQKVAMVFQNPDNQLVSSIVEEDIEFGPENLNLSEEEVKQRVDKAIQVMGLTDLRLKSPYQLSGGQKQRVAVASALAMEPSYLVLDEPTSMLDRKCRKELILYLNKLNKEYGLTIILITHSMEDLIDADRIIYIEQGQIATDKTPVELFNQCMETNLNSPDIVKLLQLQKKSGFPADFNITTCEEMVDYLCRLSNLKI